MPKMKTHKGYKKRVKKTAAGNFKRSQAFTSHLMANKFRKNCKTQFKPRFTNKS